MAKSSKPKVAPKKGKPKHRPFINTAENSVKLTNLDSGESIPLVFRANVSYSNNSGGARNLVVTCGAAIITPASVSVATGTSGDFPFQITHAAVGAGHVVHAELVDPATGTVLASDNVDPVDIVDSANNPPVTITSTAMPPGTINGLPELSPGIALIGTITPAAIAGDVIVVILEQAPPHMLSARKNAARRPVAFVGSTILAVGARNWSHPIISTAASGHHLRVLLTRRGKVKTIVRGIFG